MSNIVTTPTHCAFEIVIDSACLGYASKTQRDLPSTSANMPLQLFTSSGQVLAPQKVTNEPFCKLGSHFHVASLETSHIAGVCPLGPAPWPLLPQSLRHIRAFYIKVKVRRERGRRKAKDREGAMGIGAQYLCQIAS